MACLENMTELVIQFDGAWPSKGPVIAVALNLNCSTTSVVHSFNSKLEPRSSNHKLDQWCFWCQFSC